MALLAAALAVEVVASSHLEVALQEAHKARTVADSDSFDTMAAQDNLAVAAHIEAGKPSAVLDSVRALEPVLDEPADS